MVVPQVILNFKWSSNEESSLKFKSSRLSSEWPILGHRGRSPTTIGIKVTRSYTWCLKSYTSSVHQKYKIQVSTIYPNATLCIKKMHTFYGNWWQRGRVWYKDMKYARGIREVGFVHEYGQRGCNIEKLRRIKILGQEKHTSRGSKLMNLIGCIWYVHIYVLTCIA